MNREAYTAGYVVCPDATSARVHRARGERATWMERAGLQEHWTGNPMNLAFTWLPARRLFVERARTVNGVR